MKHMIFKVLYWFVLLERIYVWNSWMISIHLYFLD